MTSSRKRPRAPAPAKAFERLKGRRVRVQLEAKILEHYASCPTAPERVSIFVDGVITIIPVCRIEVLP